VGKRERERESVCAIILLQRMSLECSSSSSYLHPDPPTNSELQRCVCVEGSRRLAGWLAGVNFCAELTKCKRQSTRGCGPHCQGGGGEKAVV